MTNKELVIAFFMEGYVHHNYDFLMKNMAADYFDNSPCAARSNQECVSGTGRFGPQQLRCLPRQLHPAGQVCRAYGTQQRRRTRNRYQFTRNNKL